MNCFTIEQITAFERHLNCEERSRGTVEKYLRDVRQFTAWLDGSPVTKEAVAGWKEHLLTAGREPSTVNGKLASLNAFLCFLGRKDCCVRSLRLQRKLFRDAGKELTRAEYERLTQTAQTLGKARLSLLMETICATGIRVSEVKYITVEAAGRRSP